MNGLIVLINWIILVFHLQDAFYNNLKQEELTNKDYEHVKNVYKELKITKFVDYHMTYLKCDVLLLADVFENFRNMCMNYYKLDPASYLSAPGLSWDAMLLYTKIDLDLITDIEILNMIEEMKRGGLCAVGSKRHVKVNNKYLSNYDKKKISNFLLYLDANNLYGWAMSQFLPFRNLRFCDDTLEQILNTPDNASEGYIVKCDLVFPVELHDKFKEFPPCPESTKPKIEWFSDYQKKLAEKLGIIKNDKLRATT
jgi:hypothetical protein